MTEYLIDAAAFSDKGRVRGNNEDNLYLNGTFMPLEEMDNGISVSAASSDATQIYSVCDGMGGLESGELASHAVVSCMKGYPFTAAKDIQAAINDFCSKANDAVYHSADGKPGEKRNGSTFTCVAIHSKSATVAHIGDSRIYRMHQGVLEQVTRDHSEVQRMIDLGFLTPEQALVHPKRHTLTRYLGADPTEFSTDPTIGGPYPLATGDRYVLCSDGLCDMISKDRIQEILLEHTDSLEAAKALADAALEAGGKDNVTLIVLTVKNTVKKGFSPLDVARRLRSYLSGE